MRLNLIKCALVQGINEVANDFATLLEFGTADNVNNCWMSLTLRDLNTYENTDFNEIIVYAETWNFKIIFTFLEIFIISLTGFVYCILYCSADV